MRELGGRAEGNVDVALQYFRDVRAGDVHAARELGLGKSERLHLPKHAPEEGRDDVVDSLLHGECVGGLGGWDSGRWQRSAPVGYTSSISPMLERDCVRGRICN